MNKIKERLNKFVKEKHLPLSEEDIDIMINYAIS